MQRLKLRAGLTALALIAAPLALAACKPAAQIDAVMRQHDEEERNKAIVRESLRLLWDERDPQAAVALISPDYREHTGPGGSPGAEGFLEGVHYILDSTPELRAEIKQIVADGDLVAIQVHWIPAPGERGSVAYDLFRLRDGKITDHWYSSTPLTEADIANPNGAF